MAENEVVGGAMLSLEQVWLQKTLGDALETTKKIFTSLGQELGSPIIKVDNVQGLLKALGESGAKVFRDLFSDEQWNELEASQAAIHKGDVNHVRAVRIQRRRQFIAATRSVVIDVVDDTIAEELKGLMQEVSDQLAVMGQQRLLEQQEEVVEEHQEEVAEDHDEEEQESARDHGSSTGHSYDSNSGSSDGSDDSSEHGSDHSVEDDEPGEKSVDVGLRLVGQRNQKRIIKKRDDPPPRKLLSRNAKKVRSGEGGVVAKDVVGRNNIVADEDDEELDEDAPPPSTPAEMLKKMKESVAVVESTMKLSGKEVGVGALLPPDPSTCGEEWGQILLKDGQRLASVLADSDSGSPTPVQRVAKLQQGFDLCKKAFAIASLLAAIRPKKLGKNVTTLEQRYATLKAKLEREGNRCCAYRQACRYDALATFLKSYPRAILQIEIVTLRAWTYWLGKDRLPSIIAEEQEEFWTRIPKGGDDNNSQEICLQCGGDELVAELWFCAECTCWFHETCCGYEKGSLCKEVAFPAREVKELDVYCSKCLAEIGMTHDDIMENLKETRSIGLFLSDEECTFDLEPIVGDGYCIFNCLEGFARDQLGFSGTSNKFCGELAKAALQSLQNTRKELGKDSIEQSVIEALNALVRSKARVSWLKSGEWQGVEVQHLVLGYLRMFPQAQVIIYGASNKGWVVSQDQGYGNGAKVLYLLQWRTIEHYDRLKLKRR